MGGRERQSKRTVDVYVVEGGGLWVGVVAIVVFPSPSPPALLRPQPPQRDTSVRLRCVCVRVCDPGVKEVK